jgi:hypothetical protein
VSELVLALQRVKELEKELVLALQRVKEVQRVKEWEN